MKHLWEIEHPYYCSDTEYHTPVKDLPLIYDSWEAFDWKKSDVDMNLVFRWDWLKPDPEDGEDAEPSDVLWVFFMGQRKGIYTPVKVYVTEADEPEVRKWLQERWKHMLKLWEPFSNDLEDENETLMSELDCHAGFCSHHVPCNGPVPRRIHDRLDQPAKGQ